MRIEGQGPVLAVVAAIIAVWYLAAALMNAPLQRDLFANSGAMSYSTFDLAAADLNMDRPKLPAPHQVGGLPAGRPPGLVHTRRIDIPASPTKVSLSGRSYRESPEHRDAGHGRCAAWKSGVASSAFDPGVDARDRRPVLQDRVQVEGDHAPERASAHRTE